MKQFTILFSSFVLSITAIAQMDSVTLANAGNTPTATFYSPVYRVSAASTVTHARSNILVTAAELQAIGLPTGASIRAVAFRKNNIHLTIKPMDYKLYMANSSRTGFAGPDTWNDIQATHTLVYSNAAHQVPLDSGWTKCGVGPFIYTGGALELATEQFMEGNGGASALISWRYDASLPTNLIEGQVKTGSFPDTLNGTNTSNLRRPNIRIYYVMGALPVQLEAFTANRQAKDVLINWSVTGETNMQGYTVERSTDGSSFNNIAEQKASNNSSYQIKDHQAPNSLLYYRLKMLEKDGSSSYSKTVLVRPVNKSFDASMQTNGLLQVQAIRIGKLMVQLLTMEGKLLYRMEQHILAGASQFMLPVNNLTKGCYMLTLQLDAERQVIKLLR